MFRFEGTDNYTCFSCGHALSTLHDKESYEGNNKADEVNNNG
jgi:hypothetical protein